MISGVGSFGGGYGMYDVRTRTYIPPSPDELNEFDLHRAYICPACGHPTMEHEFAGGSMSMVLSCCHEDMIRVPTLDHQMDFTDG